MKFEFTATERNILLDFGVEVTQSDVRLRESSSSAVLDLISQTMDVDFRIAQRDGRHVISAEMGFFPSISYVVNENGAVNIIIEGLTGTQTINDLVTLTLLDARLLELADALSTVGLSIWLPKSAGIAHPLTGDLYRSIGGTAYKALSAIDNLLGIGDERIGMVMLGDMFIEHEEVVEAETEGEGEGDDESEEEVTLVTYRKNITELLRHLYLENVGTEESPHLMLRSDIAYYTAAGGINDGLTATGVIDNTLFYRLDRWDEYVDDSQYGWVLSGALGVEMNNTLGVLSSRVTSLEQYVSNLEISGGASAAQLMALVSFTIPDSSTGFGTLTIGSLSYNLSLASHSHSQYLEAQVFNNIFGVSSTAVSLLVAAGQSARNFNVTGQIAATGNVSAGGAISAVGNISSQASITAAGNITAGAAASGDALGNILYRLDSWTGYSDASYGTYVPAASLVNALKSRIEELESAIESIGGASGAGAAWGTETTGQYVELEVGSTTKTISLATHTHADYLLASVFNNLFSVTDSMLTILKVGNANRGLTIPGNLSVINISASGPIVSSANITAGAAASGDALGNILYRLDSWDAYTSAKASWVPAASIIKARFDDIESAIENLPGTGGTSASWGTETAGQHVELDVDSTVKTLSLAAHTHSTYLPIADFEAIFDVQTSLVSLLAATGQTVRGLHVPGPITAAGNITAGAVSADTELGPNILYRLDDWEDYDESGTSTDTTNWVPSAEIVNARFEEIEAAIENIGPGSTVEEYDDTELRSLIFSLQQADTALASRVTALEARPTFVYVGPSEDYPSDANKIEGVLYIKLHQTAS